MPFKKPERLNLKAMAASTLNTRPILSPLSQGKSRPLRTALWALAGYLFLGGCLPSRTVIVPPEISAPIPPSEKSPAGDSLTEEQRKIKGLIQKLEETEQRLQETQRKADEALKRVEEASRITEEASGRIEKAQHKIENLERKYHP
jgi:DNA repair exonuclease SbcCD ATPase subunit